MGKEAVDLLRVQGLDSTAIEMVAIKLSVDALYRLEQLAMKHEIRREEIVQEVEGRRKLRKPRQRSNGKLPHKNGVDQAQPLLPAAKPS
jgi:hypothetical protein